MRSTDIKEKRQLMEWAQSHIQDTFNVGSNEASYFRERGTDDTYIMEYDFSSIADLKSLMGEVSGVSIPEDVTHMLAVAAFREKPELADLQQTISNEQKNIPEFIYVF